MPGIAGLTTRPDDTSDFGDFVSNEDEGLDLEEVVEPWHKYAIKETPNVFYPIYLGEVLNERYLVEHKVGFGGGSTVWMAHDLHDKRDVALKVMSLGDWGGKRIPHAERNTSERAGYLSPSDVSRNFPHPWKRT